MNELTDRIYAIMFFDGSIKWANQKQRDALMERSGNPNLKTFEIDGGMYNFNQVAKIITAEEYWDQYPHKKPQPETKPFKVEKDYRPFNPLHVTGRSKKRIEALLRGFKRGLIEIAGSLENAKPENQKFIKRMEKKLNELSREMP